MLSAKRGEVWLVDLGMAAKPRPAFILSIPFLDNERALYSIVPHTTATRGGRFEVVATRTELSRFGPCSSAVITVFTTR